MPTFRFDHVRAKLNRVDSHLRKAKLLAKEFQAKHPIIIEPHPQTGRPCVVANQRPPNDLLFALGDAAVNVRGAFDWIAFEIAAECGLPKQKLYYPITVDKSSFIKAIEKDFGLCPQHTKDVLLWSATYKEDTSTGNNAYYLNDIVNEHKHRNIIAAMQVVSIENFCGDVGEGYLVIFNKVIRVGFERHRYFSEGPGGDVRGAIVELGVEKLLQGEPKYDWAWKVAPDTWRSIFEIIECAKSLAGSVANQLEAKRL